MRWSWTAPTGSTPTACRESVQVQRQGRPGTLDRVHVIDAGCVPRPAETMASPTLDAAETMGSACRNGDIPTVRGVRPAEARSPPRRLPAAVADHARRWVYIADEVQVGFDGWATPSGALRTMWYPTSWCSESRWQRTSHGAVVTTRDRRVLQRNGVLLTFGGNPVSCRCGLAVLDVIEDELPRSGRGKSTIQGRSPSGPAIRPSRRPWTRTVSRDRSVLDPIARPIPKWPAGGSGHDPSAFPQHRWSPRQRHQDQTAIVLTEADIDMTIRGLDDATRFDSN